MSSKNINNYNVTYRVMVIDDDINWHQTIQSNAILKQYFIFDCFTENIKAQLALKNEKNKYDLVLLDLRLAPKSKRLDGLDLIPLLRNELDQAGIPIVIFSENRDTRVSYKTGQLGAKDYLDKSDYNPSKWKDILLGCIHDNYVRHINDVIDKIQKELLAEGDCVALRNAMLKFYKYCEFQQLENEMNEILVLIGSVNLICQKISTNQIKLDDELIELAKLRDKFIEILTEFKGRVVP